MVSKKLAKYDAADVNRPVGERWISMSNGLTRAGHALTLSEKRVVALGLSRLDSRRNYGVGALPRVRITAAEYAETFKVDPDTAYDQLRSAAKTLYSRSISFFEPAHHRRGAPLKLGPGTQRWIENAFYYQGEGYIELTWAMSILPHLTGLKKQFTTYQLMQASALRTASSWRLLELLTRFRSTGVAEYTVEDFAASMDATEKQRADFAKIRTKIIEPAVRELEEKDGWLIQWEPVKAGRKVRAIRFTFERDPQGRLDV